MIPQNKQQYNLTVDKEYMISFQEKNKQQHAENNVSLLQKPKKYRFESKRKLSPIDCDLSQFNYEKSILSLELKLSNCRQKKQTTDKSIAIKQQWIFNEFFIANCDESYLSRNQMLEIIKEVFPAQLTSKFSQRQVQVIKFKTFKSLQKSLPKPKLFNEYYIEIERKTIQDNRIFLRNKIQNSKKETNNRTLKRNQSSSSCLQVGDKVWAFCSLCNHVHPGNILSQYRDSYLIKFNNVNLGALKVPEYYVSSNFMKNYNQQQQQSGYIMKNNKTYKTQINSNLIDFQALGTYRYLIQLKGELINLLKKYHNLAQSRKQHTCALTEIQLQEYGWIGSMIGIITIAMKYVQSNFCILGYANSQNFRQKGNKTYKLPFLYLSETYTKSCTGFSQESQEKKQSKKSFKNSEDIIITQKHQEQRMIQQIDKKYKNILNDIPEKQKKEQLNQTVKLTINILNRLRTKREQYNIEQDSCEKQLQKKYIDKLPEKITQIHNRLKNISQKFSQT